MPLLHEHLMLPAEGRVRMGSWGSVHPVIRFESTVAASALYREIVMAEVCEAAGSGLRAVDAVTAGCCPVMEAAGVSHD
ncbi:hypothetical protein AB0H45_17850 [Streptomyces atroolivaceus]|nr:hypothetical protein [Streptomyces atroolivaceus]